MKSIINLFIILLIAYYSEAHVIKVNQRQGSKSNSIQDAINSAGIGDTVLVTPGIYYETIDFTGKNITVASQFLLSGDTAHISQTIIDGNHNHNRLVKFTHGESRNARLVGFTITNAYDDTAAANIRKSGLGIYIENSSPCIEDNHIINSEFGEWYIAGGGIVMINSGALIRHNLISHNDYAHQGGGIYVEGGSGQLITENYISGHYLISGYGVAQGGGIYLYYTHGSTISNNIIEENHIDFGDGSAIYAALCNSLTITGNILRNGIGNSSYGELVLEYCHGDVINNLIYNVLYPNSLRVNIIYSQLRIINTTIINHNELSVRLENSTVQLINSILYGENTSVSGKQIQMINSSLIARYSDIDGDTTSIEKYGSNSITSDHTIALDPLFSGDEAYPYSLSDDSPCINQGCPDTATLNLPSLDLAGFPRFIPERIDIGAYENQIYNHLSPLTGKPILSVFPNPAHEFLQITYPDHSPGKQVLKIYSITGFLLLEKLIDGKTQINLERFTAGTYIAVIYQDGEMCNEQFVVL